MTAAFSWADFDTFPLHIKVFSKHECLVVFTVDPVGEGPSALAADGNPMQQAFDDPIPIAGGREIQAWYYNSSAISTVEITSDSPHLGYGFSYKNAVFLTAEFDSGTWDPDAEEPQPRVTIEGEEDAPILGFVLTDGGEDHSNHSNPVDSDPLFDLGFGDDDTGTYWDMVQWISDGSAQTLGWDIGGVDDAIVWGEILVAFSSVLFEPSPCAEVYLDIADAIDVTDNTDIDTGKVPDYGKTQPFYWVGPADDDMLPTYHASGGPNDRPYLFFNYGKGIADTFLPETPIPLNQVVDFSHSDRTTWTIFGFFRLEFDGSNRDDLSTFPELNNIFTHGLNIVLAGINEMESAVVAVRLQGADDSSVIATLPIPTNEWFYFEARQTATKLWVRVNDTETSVDAIPISPEFNTSDYLIQLGGGFIQWDVAYFQMCNIAIRCAQLEERRWQLQDRYGFPLSPIVDCTDDPTLGGTRPFCIILD